MISDVEEKTYEFGMLRALGFKKESLITLMII
jgi:ABC-type antimicrobial peptide transport system permease subunit